MNIKIIACKVFWRELSIITATSPHYCDVTYLQQGLHAYPDKLRKAIGNEIAEIESGEDIHTNYPVSSSDRAFDAILLCYALCAASIEGISAKKHTLVIPRAHDCITVLLGSAKRYNEYFFEKKGTFWSSAGWVECWELPDENSHKRILERYKATRGEKTAGRLALASESWKHNYSNLAYIKWDEIDSENNIEKCKNCAKYNGWDFEVLTGDSSLMRRFVNCDWDDDEFLTVPAGGEIVRSYDERIITYNGN